MNVAAGRGRLAAVGRKDLAGSVLPGRVGLVDVGVVGAGYRIYSNHGAGVVDFATSEGRVSTNARHWAKAGLSYPGTWRFVVRAYNAAASELNVDREASVGIEADGGEEPVRPASPMGLEAQAGPGGTVKLSFSYEEEDGEPEATHFHVYHDNGTGVIDEGTVVAEIARTGGMLTHYVHQTGALVGGKTYRFRVKAVTAAGAESETSEFVAVTADAAGPEQPTELTGKLLH